MWREDPGPAVRAHSFDSILWVKWQRDIRMGNFEAYSFEKGAIAQVV